MPRSHTRAPRVLLGAALSASVIGVAAHRLQARPTIESDSVSHIVEVAPVETTPERIASLKLPPGFTISKFAEMENPRMIKVAPNGDIYISQREPGTLVLLKDTNHDGRADMQKVVATRKDLHGIAIKGSNLYFVTIRELYRAPIKADGTLGKPKLLIDNLPDAGQHPNRVINFGPDGRLFMQVGSSENAYDERNKENATILVANGDGRNRRVYATGLRNTIGFGWHPTTGRMIGWDQGMDTFGDNNSKEEINEIKQGKRYGFPFVYEMGKLNAHPLPPAGYTREMWRNMSQKPLLLHTAHSAGMEMTFYTGKQFPAEYRNDAFIALRGSWNRNPPSGYQLARIHFNQSGTPVSVTPFVDGFLLKNPKPGVSWGHFGRLCGTAMLPDGSMLLSDDTNNIVYRIAYGAKNTPRKLTDLDARKITSELPAFAKIPNTITVKSNTFKDMDGMPLSSTAYDKSISPDLRWAGVPKSAKSIVLMMEDPDALSPKPFPHWLAANIAPRVTMLPKGVPNVEFLPAYAAMQGSNNTSTTGYYGPKPPADGIVHHYNFQVFALNTRLKLLSGYNRQALIDAMKGHVIAKGKIVGLFKRSMYGG